MSWNERPGAVNETTGCFGYLHGSVVLKLFEVAMETVHEFGVFDWVNDKCLGYVTTREEIC